MIRISLPLALAFVTLMTATATVSDAQAQTTHRPPTSAMVDTNHLVTLNREVFRYSSNGQRDPFVSLSTSSEIRPTLSDLRLTTIALDPTGRNSVAILRDLGTKEQYRVKVGSELGRMRVIRIDQKTVTFAIEEFGFNRQATLVMGDSTRTTSTRTP
jgi:hypothetical protein